MKAKTVKKTYREMQTCPRCADHFKPTDNIPGPYCGECMAREVDFQFADIPADAPSILAGRLVKQYLAHDLTFAEVNAKLAPLGYTFCPACYAHKNGAHGIEGHGGG